MRRLFVILVALTGFAWPAIGSAQQVQRIVAIVNDEVITALDLEARVRLVIFSARLQDNAQVRRRIATQVLRTLVDERLQMQEAKRRNVSVSKRDLNRAIGSIEKQNKIPQGQLDAFLASRGIPVRTLQDQIRANVAWSKLLRRRIGPRISVSPDEVEEFIDRLKSRQGQPEYRIAEILLTVESAQELAQVRQSAQRLVEQIRGGAPFRAVARQFSRSATAAVGGDLGWLHESELEDDLKPIVPNMSRGQVSNPIRIVSGFRIIALLGKRRVAAAGPEETTVDLQQIFIRTSASDSPEDVESKLGVAGKLNESIGSCADVAETAKRVGSTRPPSLGKFALADLSPAIRSAVADLKTGQTSKPVRLPDGILVLVVCDRTEPSSQIPEPEEVQRMLRGRRVALMSRRYMRDIRLAAVVDLRV